MLLDDRLGDATSEPKPRAPNSKRPEVCSDRSPQTAENGSKTWSSRCALDPDAGVGDRDLDG